MLNITEVSHLAIHNAWLVVQSGCSSVPFVATLNAAVHAKLIWLGTKQLVVRVGRFYTGSCLTMLMMLFLLGMVPRTVLAP